MFILFFNADEWKEAVNMKQSWLLLSLVQSLWLLCNVARDEFGSAVGRLFVLTACDSII